MQAAGLPTPAPSATKKHLIFADGTFPLPSLSTHHRSSDAFRFYGISPQQQQPQEVNRLLKFDETGPSTNFGHDRNRRRVNLDVREDESDSEDEDDGEVLQLAVAADRYYKHLAQEEIKRVDSILEGRLAQTVTNLDTFLRNQESKYVPAVDSHSTTCSALTAHQHTVLQKMAITIESHKSAMKSALEELDSVMEQIRTAGTEFGEESKTLMAERQKGAQLVLKQMEGRVDGSKKRSSKISKEHDESSAMKKACLALIDRIDE
ncbi:hypothetical protein DFS34DRAFT_698057 [Phlyctochytrium arcticum]|nr:hypothetical protein DFS34DRAFT_698057 [Phlyctochytrium arcticum]